MGLLINNPWKDSMGNEYPFRYIKLYPTICGEEVSIGAVCHGGIDIKTKKYGKGLNLLEFRRFENFRFPMEEGANVNLMLWSCKKVIHEIIFPTYEEAVEVKYKNDIYKINEELGEIELDKETNKPIIIHQKGDTIYTYKGYPFSHDVKIPAFCDEEDIEIILID